MSVSIEAIGFATALCAGLALGACGGDIGVAESSSSSDECCDGAVHDEDADWGSEEEDDECCDGEQWEECYSDDDCPSGQVCDSNECIDAKSCGDQMVEATCGNGIVEGYEECDGPGCETCQSTPTLVWQLESQGEAGFELFGAAADPDGNLVAVGRRAVEGGDDVAWIGKFSPSGESMWTASEPAPSGHAHYNSVTIAPDGTIFAGGSFPLQADASQYLVAYDSDGGQLWEHIGEPGAIASLTTTAAGDAVASAGDDLGNGTVWRFMPDGVPVLIYHLANVPLAGITRLSSGDFVVVGNAAQTAFMTRIDPDGEVQWQVSPEPDGLGSIVRLDDVTATPSGIWAVGQAGDGLWVSHRESNNSSWMELTCQGLTPGEATSVAPAADGGVLVGGVWREWAGGMKRPWALEYGSNQMMTDWRRGPSLQGDALDGEVHDVVRTAAGVTFVVGSRVGADAIPEAFIYAESH